MDWPAPRFTPPAIMHPHHIDALGSAVSSGVLNAVSSTTWPSANKAFFYPFTLYDFVTVYQLLFWVGAASSGNIDVGIYDSQGNRIISSGSTAMSATVDTIQEINIADTELPPGNYFLAVAVDNATGRCYSSSIADELILSEVAVYEMAAAFPLPTSATMVSCTDGTVNIFSIGAQLVPTF